MTKRLLFFVAFCFVSISLVKAQCNKIYKATINEQGILSSEFKGRQYDALSFCKGTKISFRLNNLDADVLKIRWFRNDSLIANTPDLESDIVGVYRCEIETQSCLYRLGKIIYEVSDNIYVVLSNEEEMTICENGNGFASLNASVFTADPHITYQWQKNGEDIPGKTSNYLHVNTPGVYAVRATAGACSSTSPPATVKSNTDNLLKNSIFYYDGREIKNDTAFLCKDFANKLQSSHYSDWFLNGNYVASGYEFIPTQSGFYKVSSTLGTNCFAKSDSAYISIGTKISPIKFNFVSYDNLCNTKEIFFVNSDFKTPNTLKFYDSTTNILMYTYQTPEIYFYDKVPIGKYKVEFEAGSCKSLPSYIDLTKNILQLQSNGKKIGGKKINLCSNNIMEVYVNYSEFDDVSLYKDGVLVRKKSKHEYYGSDFKISSSGKYYMKIFNDSCPTKLEILSDTVEVIVAEPISTNISVSEQSCDSKTLTAMPYDEVSYYWYKDKNLVSDARSSTLTLNKNTNGTYYAVLQKGLCSVATQSITFGNQIIGSTNICQDAKLVLESKNTPVSWKGPDGFTSNESKINIENIQPKQAGWYSMSSNLNGCTYKDSVKVNITSKPDFSFDFAGPICLNQDLVGKFKGPQGYYSIEYSLLGNKPVRSGIYLYGSGSPNVEKYIKLGKVEPASNKEYFTLQYSGCNFSLAIPSHTNSPEICADSFEFTNLKEKYCYKEKTELKFKLPANTPADKKFKVKLQSYWETYVLGYFSGNHTQITMPSINGNTINFVIEDEEGKFVAISKDFIISGLTPYISAKIGEDYTSYYGLHCEGYSTTIISSNTATALQWAKDGVDIIGANNTTFEARESGSYTLKSTYDGCVVESSEVVIKTGEIRKPEISSLISVNIACHDFAVPLKLNHNFAYTNYSWKRNNQLIDTTSANYLFEARESGYYKLSAYQGSCEASSDSIWVEIGQSLSNNIYTNNSNIDNKIYLCTNLTANFYNSDYYVYSSSEDEMAILNKYGFNFQWKRNNKDIAGAINKEYSTSEPGVYYLQLKQGDCVVNSQKFEVITEDTLHVNAYHKFPFSDANKTISLCKNENDSYVFYISQPFEKMYGWNINLYKNGQLIETRTADKNNYTNNGFAITESGKYSTKLYSPEQNTCIALSDTVVFNITNKPIIMPTDTVRICADTAYLRPNYSGTSYRWLQNDRVISTSYDTRVYDEGLYTVEAAQTSTCSFVQPIFFKRTLNPSLSYNWSTQNTPSLPLCEGLSFSMSIYDVNFGPGPPGPDFNFEWYNGQRRLSNSSNYLKVSEAGNYFAKVKYKACEGISNALKIDVVKIKNQISPLVDSLGICANGGFQTLEAPKEPGYTYEWFKDNSALEENSYTLKVTQPGTYKALIQSGNCSALTQRVKIYTSAKAPIATISGDTTLNIGDTVNLKLAFTSSPPFTYKLNNNQEGTSDKNTIIHPVKIQESTIFKLASIKNACGEGTVSGEAKVNVIILSNEPLIGHKIIIAPVPAESYCEIIFDLPTSQKVSYQLLDMKGQPLSEKNLGQVTYKKQYLNLNHLTAGEYLIKIQVGRDLVTRKLIKY
jgi:hypothetical protein